MNKKVVGICLALVLVVSYSCKKEHTSDFPEDYYTDIWIEYSESSERTDVYTRFYIFDQKTSMAPTTSLQLPEDSYIQVNGVLMSWQPEYYFHTFDGKAVCSFELKDHDGTLYHNIMVPPDSAFFVNLPDTISSASEIELQINPPLLDSNESSWISLSTHPEYNGGFYYGDDSLIALDDEFLIKDHTHTLWLHRTKSIPVPDLPNLGLEFGGGHITFDYIVERSFYYQ